MPPHTSRHEFAFAPAYRLPALIFAITPRTAYALVEADDLLVRFGPWRLRTPLSNVAGTEESRDFAFLKTAGPAHLSFSDRGVTFATNGDLGVCVRFHEPVRALDPTGRLRHPGLTMTLADPHRFREDLVL